MERREFSQLSYAEQLDAHILDDCHHDSCPFCDACDIIDQINIIDEELDDEHCKLLY